MWKKYLPDFLNIQLGWNRPISSYSKVQILYSKMIRGKKFQLKKLEKNPKEYINVGCGQNYHPDFINIDSQWRPNIELCWNITKGLPLETNSANGIFSEHCLEHISYHQCYTVLKDFHRILRKGRVVRIVVPDAELYLNLYQKDKQGKAVRFPYVSEQDLQDTFTPIMAVNRVFRDFGHLFAYDARTLELLLNKAGFDEIRKESFMKGRCKKLLIDSEARMIESLYIEALAT